VKTKKPKMYRQGDVLIVACDRVEVAKQVEREGGRIVLAHGEVTGHAHAISSMDATLFMDEATLNRYLDVRAPVTLDHEEHGRIELPSGFYEVRRQREYRPEGLRQVAD
jgi:hypothetical protein